MTHAIAIPAFSDNYIWLIPADGDNHHQDKPVSKVAIVDPGDATRVLETLKQHHLTPVAILITHHHYDHVGGIRGLLQHYQLPVYGPANENIAAIDHPLREGDTFTLPGDNKKISVLDVPGHTAGHIAYYTADMLFCGDTLFAGGCGRLFEGTAKQMFNSLQKIISLPDNTRIYCAHEYTLANLKFAQLLEPDNQELQVRLDETLKIRAENRPTIPSTLILEKRTNPFLRCDTAAVTRAAEQFSGKPLGSDVAVFTAIRYWKDTV